MSAGIRIVKDNRRAVAKDVHNAAVLALDDAAEFLLEESNRTVPIEEGTLGRSGHVITDWDNAKSVVAYDTPYAVRQHEDTRLNHDAGRRAKWLEFTFHEQGKRVGAFIADRMKRALR